ncbi:hypothetical protein BWP39_09740 [Paraburkholderia acidicola]|uniref:Uncharacterized protein n=1 Tax=Paraburkholderia acidicola TaxID=1912599 RepID=A0A2A4F3X6_9BURK|nr:hypothetical protein [Paraburkholderia acidicola]PCE27059.1 hypothetical protein BWP39_09740 [Paraburkholderia acidicola]
MPGKLSAYEAELEMARATVEKFRERWEKKIAAVAQRVKLFKPIRGRRRYAYLVNDDEPVLDQFVRAWKRASLQVETFTGPYGKGASRAACMPTTERGCRRVTLKVYRTMNRRPVDENVARAFLLRLGDDLPKGNWRYIVRSETGAKYRLRVRKDNRWEYLPVTEWVVLGCIGDTGKIAQALEPEEVDRAALVKTWSTLRGLKFLVRDPSTAPLRVAASMGDILVVYCRHHVEPGCKIPIPYKSTTGWFSD